MEIRQWCPHVQVDSSFAPTVMQSVREVQSIALSSSSWSDDEPNSATEPHLPDVSVAEIPCGCATPSWPTAVQSDASAQLTPLSTPLALLTLVDAPQDPSDSVIEKGLTLPSVPTAVHSVIETQLTRVQLPPEDTKYRQTPPRTRGRPCSLVARSPRSRCRWPPSPRWHR